VVNLSSLGGHTPVGVGIVAGLAKLEVKLNGLKEVNILHLRSGYFMENLLGSIGMIKNMGVVGGPIKHDVSMSLIATQDIAQVAAEKLMKLDFSGHSVLPLMGPRNYTMDEVWTVLSAAIGKPDLRYAQFPAAQVKEGLMQMMGVSESVADSFIGLSEGMNNGLLNVEKSQLLVRETSAGLLQRDGRRRDMRYTLGCATRPLKKYGLCATQTLL
jgi:uncharacterized protein YbjT (DUF2867 family)